MMPFLFLVSVTVFVLIKLPPGDFVCNYAATLASSGETVNDAMLAAMRAHYGLDQPLLGRAVPGCGSATWRTAISATPSSGSSRSSR